MQQIDITLGEALLINAMIAIPGILGLSIAFHATRASQDPFDCEAGCLHMRGCGFYVEGTPDARYPKAEPPSAFEIVLEAPKSPIYILGRALLEATHIPGIVRTGATFRVMREKRAQCKCQHTKPSCNAKIVEYVRPPSPEYADWTPVFDGQSPGFRSPCGSKWTKAIEVSASSSQALSDRATEILSSV